MDIDCDLDPQQKEEIFKRIRLRLYKEGEKFYTKEYLKPFLKIGQFAQVATYGTAALKAAIQMAGRAWVDEEHPDGLIQEGQYLSSLITSKRGSNADLKKTLLGDEDSGDKPNYAFIKEVEKYEGLLQNIKELEGLIKQKGVHAGGVIMFTRPFWEISPLMKSNVGGVVTQYDLHDIETTGGLKFDFLSTKVPTKLRYAIKLAQKDGLIDKELSLREAYNKYLHPSNADFKDEVLYEEIGKGEIFDLFQFSGSVGVQASKLTKPKTVEELTAASALMRLMADRGEENQLSRFARFKDNLNLWYDEMDNVGLTKDEQKVLEKYYFCGLAPYQETFMRILMDKNVSNFTLGEANNARKIIAKKQISKIPELTELFYSRVKNKIFADYIYKTAIKPSLGYAFSINHSLPYSMIAVQEAIIYCKFGRTYWNTASLITESNIIEDDEVDELEEIEEELFEVDEGKSSLDIGKISKAILKMKDWGIKILPPDINKSEVGFTPNAKEDIIYCGLSNISGINKDDINEIIEKRPFANLEHFMQEFSGNITKKLNCVRAGLFGDYEGNLRTLLSEKSPEKLNLDMKNAQALITKGLFPKDLEKETKAFMMAKSVKKNKIDKEQCFANSSQVEEFLELFGESCVEEYRVNDIGDTEVVINIKLMDNILKKFKATLKNWLTANKEEILKRFNESSINEVLSKYYLTEERASLKVLGYYQKEHEFEKINELDRYGFANFFRLAEEPPIANYFNSKEGYKVPLYKIEKIAGTVIAKDDLKKSVTLLTVDGVVDVKIPAVEVYSKYKKTISQFCETENKNKKVEGSWFERGTFLIIYGFRRGEEFVAKTYRNTGQHVVNKFDIIDGTIQLCSRKLRDA